MEALPANMRYENGTRMVRKQYEIARNGTIMARKLHKHCTKDALPRLMRVAQTDGRKSPSTYFNFDPLQCELG